ncbi:MAG TPA: copper amine oxidase N-terminal domain-containing protein [Candidatus Eremiobacteraceae bacterium]
MAAADFGSPPSGEVPIIFNDHHIYAKPDELKQSRVLAALVKDGTIFVPLRSMFEQMGATVSWDEASKSATAQKPGASVQVTVGKNEVVLNGETRPLDVPPEMYHGVIVVPVRVMSEALGAYVEWLPDRHICVVRYIPPTPVPAAPPTAAPTAAPTAPTPTPTPTAGYNGFIQAAVADSKIYNEFSAGQRCCSSYVASGGYAFKDSPIAIKVDYRQDTYVTSDNVTNSAGSHFTRFTTIDGGTAFTPVFKAQQSTFDGRLEYQVMAPRIYVGVGYLQTADNYGYPHLDAFGVGVEKLPGLQPGLDFFGSTFYYPTASGDYTVTAATSPNVGRTFKQQYRIMKYDLGLSLDFGDFPVYLYGGFSGDRYTTKQNAPINQTHSGPYIGLGVRF